jgi:hypothetical protein
MLVVLGTRAFRDRVPGFAAAPDDVSTTLLGSWYATVLRWRRPVALLVNEATLLPLLTPLAPVRTLLERIPGAVAELLAAHHLPAAVVEAERAAMTEVRLTRTASRSILGVQNEFAYLADVNRADNDGLLELSLRLAVTPLGPLYRRHVSPDRELAVLVAEHSTRRPRAATALPTLHSGRYRALRGGPGLSVGAGLAGSPSR